MNTILKYLFFIFFLGAGVTAAVKYDLPYAYPFFGISKTGKNPAGEIPSLGVSPSQALTGVRSTGAIDYSPANNLTATGEEGRIKLWQLPDEQPVLEINAGEGFQVLQVRFLPGKEAVAGCGLTADGNGSIRIFNITTGKQTFQIDNLEPVIYMDFDRSGRYLVFTGTGSIKVWDLRDNQALSVFPRNSAGARGVFFLEDRYVLQSDTLSLYDWKNRKMAAALADDMGAVDLRKINDKLCAWMSMNGLNVLHSPYEKREFIPFNTQGIYAFDLAPDGKWGVFLKEDKTMSLIDCTTGLAVHTVGLKRRPDVVFINQDGTSVFLSYGAENIEIFDIGNETIFRNVKFYTTRFFMRLWNQMGDVTRNAPWAKNPAS
jgi:WD40 repeat protein